MTEDNTPEEPKKTKPLISLKFLLVLTLIGVIGYVIILPQFNCYGCPSEEHDRHFYNKDAKSNLHNLYLVCKAYWAEQGSDQKCDVSIASQPAYGFVKFESVNISGQGTETTFTATAQHQNSTTQYTMDANGNITEKK